MLLSAFVTVFLSVQVLAARATFFWQEKSGDDIGALCEDKEVNLSTFAQLKQLADKLQSPSSHHQCNAETKRAIAGLVEVIEQTKDDLCSMSSMLKYVEYHNSNILQRQPETVSKLPRSFVRFATAYGLQVSTLCRRHMLERLTGAWGRHAIKTAMDARARELFEGEILADAKGPVGRVLGGLGGRDEPLMPGDVRALLEKHNCQEMSLANAAIPMWQVSLDLIARIKSACQASFAPIYSPHMLPLVELANLGLSYRDQELEDLERDRTTAAEIGRWSRVAFACETLGEITIKEATTLSGGAKRQEGSRMVNILPRSEVESSPSVHLSPVRLRVDWEGTIYHKSDKRLVEALGATEINLEPRSKLISAKVLRMSRETNEDLEDNISLKHLVRELEEKLAPISQRAGAAQRLLESLNHYGMYPKEDYDW